MDGGRPIDNNPNANRVSPVDEPSRSDGATPVNITRSDAIPLTGHGAIPRRGTRLGPVVNALNNQYRNHQFTDTGLIAHLTGQATADSLTESVATVSVQAIRDNPNYYIRALFPTDNPSVRRGAFAFSDNLSYLFARSADAKAAQLRDYRRLLPLMGLEEVNFGLSVVEDFNAATHCPWLLTSNGRNLIATIIRSLHLAGNYQSARMLRDVMLSIASRTSFLPMRKMMAIASAMEADHWQIVQQNWRGARAEQSARDAITRFNFSLSRPDNGLLDLTRVARADYIRTGDRYADFLLGHNPNSGRQTIDNIFSAYDSAALNLDDNLFQDLFPIHLPDQRGANQPLVTLDTANVFANNAFLRNNQRVLAHLMLSHFGIELHGRQAHLTENFDSQQWGWLSNSGAGFDQLGIIIRIIKSLYLLSNEATAISLHQLVMAKLRDENISSGRVNNALQDLRPFGVSAEEESAYRESYPLPDVSVPETALPQSPSPPPSRQPERVQPRQPALVDQVVRQPQPQVLPQVQPTPTGIAPDQPFGFLGTPLEQYRAYMASTLYTEHYNNYVAALQDGWTAVAAAVFPVETVATSNRSLPILTDEIIAFFGTPDSASVRASQDILLRTILAHHQLSIADGDVIVSDTGFNAQTSHLFSNKANIPSPLVMTRIIRHLARTGRLGLARSLQAFLISQGLTTSVSKATLAHWHLATALDYQARTRRFDLRYASQAEANTELNNLMVAVQRTNYARIQQALLDQRPAPRPEVRPHAPPPIRQPLQQPAAVPPDGPFPFQGSDLQQFRGYLNSPILNDHIDNFVRTNQEGWTGAVAGAFPLFTQANANKHVPKLNQDMIDFFESHPQSQEEAAQLRLLDAILGMNGVQRRGSAFVGAPGFRPEGNALFSNQAPHALLMTRVIQHFTQTHRLTLARNLQAFLISEGYTTDVADITMAHWYLATNIRYSREADLLNPKSVGKQQAGERLSQVMRTINHRDYQNRQARALSQPQPRPPMQPRPQIFPRQPVVPNIPTPPAAPQAPFNPRAFNSKYYRRLKPENIRPAALRGTDSQTGLALPINLDRFRDHNIIVRHRTAVLQEIASAPLHRQLHYSWFTFPQIAGLGMSSNNVRYAISHLAEAQAFLNAPDLRRAYENALNALFTSGRGLVDIFGGPPTGQEDTIKVWSSITLFLQLEPNNPLFLQVLNTFFGGRQDENTLDILDEQRKLNIGQITQPTPPRQEAPRQPVRFVRTRRLDGGPIANVAAGMRQLQIAQPPGFDYRPAITQVANPEILPNQPDPRRPLRNVFMHTGSIANAREDVVVNAANTMLRGGGGVAGAIFRQAGPALVNEMNARYPILDPATHECGAVAQACPSHRHGFNPDVSYLIHIAGPDLNTDQPTQAQIDAAAPILERTYTNALNMALQLGAGSIALPLISSGIFGYPPDQAAAVALKICSLPKYSKLKIVFYTGKRYDRPGVPVTPTTALTAQLLGQEPTNNLSPPASRN